MKSSLVVVLLVGCASVSPDAPKDDAGGDTGSVIVDSAPMGDDGWVLVEKCPEYPPFGPCSSSLTCTYPEGSCGGELIAKCVDGKWTETSKTKCGAPCPQTKPEGGSSCSAYPSEMRCTFWPRLDEACESCTCTGGAWVCGTSCSMERSSCRNGTACAPNSGCGAGRCSNYCGCNTDGKLHCTSTLC